ncbi:hypothetical protein PVAND_012889 [Polypedilum vanderplanki]|uniref:Uncharacterized protein n=1 Tax=Polypedilum vanderplanki TaxID=319348 RepID=A0A9J6CNT8_POLVA|nr:hypothetical protein PVAND_012889 [Polypedilum vanderplanki]
MLARNLRKFKLITFDCTNTLFYFKKQPSETYLQAAIEVIGKEKKELFDPKIITSSFTENFREISKKFPNFGCGTIGYDSWWTMIVQNVLKDASHNKIDPKEFVKVAEKLIDLYETEKVYEKFEKANELINAIKKENKTVGVISNFDPRLTIILKRMKLMNFDFVITSYEARCEKPDRKIFNLALERACGFQMGIVYPSEALHIGNEIVKDCEGALDAGWSSILINSEKQSNEVPCFKDEHIENEFSKGTKRNSEKPKLKGVQKLDNSLRQF